MTDCFCCVPYLDSDLLLPQLDTLRTIHYAGS